MKKSPVFTFSTHVALECLSLPSMTQLDWEAIEDLDQEITLPVQIDSYSPGRPAVMYLRNGDPGYPEEPAEIELSYEQEIDVILADWAEGQSTTEGKLLAKAFVETFHDELTTALSNYELSDTIYATAFEAYDSYMEAKREDYYERD